MTHLRAVDAPHESRYHVSKPPDDLYGIMRKLAKATRDPAYRSHGGFHTSDAIRAEILTVSNIKIGDADDVVRFLKKHGVLRPDGDELNRVAAWVFVADVADALYGKCVAAGTATPKDKTIASYCERASDPGDAPNPDGNGQRHPSFPGRTMIANLAREAVACGNAGEDETSPRKPKHDFTSYEDELLVMHDKDLRRQIAEAQAELDAVIEEQHLRAERRRTEAELEELGKAEAELRRKLLEIEERRLEISARASGIPTG